MFTQDLARLAVCALLHDIGKPLVRCKLRFQEGREKELEKKLKDVELQSLFMKWIGEGKSHEDFSRYVEEWFGGGKLKCKLRELKEPIRRADKLAAAERGVAGEYEELRKVWNDVEDRVNAQIWGRGPRRYTHHVTPLLSPLWFLKLTKHYEDSLGPSLDGRLKKFDSEDALNGIANELRPIGALISERKWSQLADKLAELLKKLMGEELWYPVKPLADADTVVNLKTYKYDEALEKSSYADVVEYTLRSLRAIRGIYSSRGQLRITLGLADTLNEFFRFLFVFVPSAVFLAVAPDINLYSHSRLVAAYATTLSFGSDPRLLVVDARGIQSLVAAPVKAKAASRVIRGRSLLVELAADSLIEAILALMGDLPRLNVVVDKGGTVEILVPDISGINERLRKLDEYIERVEREVRGLRWSIAISDPLRREEGDLGRVLEALEASLARHKVSDEAKVLGLRIKLDELEGFDAITGEPVTKSEVGNEPGRLGFRVDEELKEYSNLISGGKLDEGDLVSHVTHLSLAIGTCARNLKAIVSIYTYKQQQLDLLEPDSNTAIRVLERLGQQFSSIMKVKYTAKRLLYKLERDGSSVNIAIVPIASLSSLHVLIAITSPKTDFEATRAGARSDTSILYEVLGEVLEAVKQALREVLGEGVRVRVRVKFVNALLEDLLAHIESRRVSEAIRSLLELPESSGGLSGSSVDASIGSFFTGTYHPITNQGELKDLEDFALIALAKADVDHLGDVRLILARLPEPFGFSPSRLVSFSDLLAINIIGLTHILAERGGRDVIMLYAGGDDIAFYGELLAVLGFLNEVYERVLRNLHPLSLTSSVAVEKYKFPVLELYTRVVEQLRKLKGTCRGSTWIADIASPQAIRDKSGVKLVYAIPVDLRGWPANQSLWVLSEILKLVEDRGKVEEHKRDLHALSRIGHDAIEAFSRAATGSAEGQLDIVRIGNILAYYCARRLKKQGRDMSAEILKKPTGICTDQDIVGVLEKLVNAKTAIDIALLALRIQSA